MIQNKFTGLSEAKRKYIDHKHRAAKRGIEFTLSFEDWNAWFLQHGVDKSQHRNGQQTRDDICMCRRNDSGAYELGNIYAATRAENSHHRAVFGTAKAPNCKQCRTPKGVFASVTAAARAHGIDQTTMHNRIQKQHEGYQLL
jgi:hypothetical protein